MKRFLSICGLAIAGLTTTGCVSPPIVSLADADPITAAANTAHERLTALPDRSLLEDYRRATIQFVPDEDLVTEEIAAPLVNEVVEVVEQQPAPAQAPTMLPTEMPRISLRQTMLQPVEPENSQPLKLQRVKPIQEISLDISPPTLVTEQNQQIALPQNDGATALPTLAQDNPFTRGDLVAAGYQWHPTATGLTFCYQPLFFEEANLERYGRSHGILQPAVSAAAFYGRIPLIPYMAFSRPARRCTMHPHWTLPGYKIGRWEPQPIVPSATGSAAELAALYGIILLIP